MLPMLALSIAMHGAAWASVARVRPVPPRQRIEVEVVRRRPPSPPPQAAPPPERPRAASREVALANPPAPRVATPPAPPPPLASAPDAPSPSDAPKPLPKVGISLGSTVASGDFAAGVGNTAYGKADESAAEPSSVGAYLRGAVPIARTSSRPKPLVLPKIDYPPDARKSGVEGQVVLVLRIDSHGAVIAVRVLDSPSPSLAEAASEGARRFRFAPALVEGEPVETEIRFTYTFLLE